MEIEGEKCYTKDALPDASKLLRNRGIYVQYNTFKDISKLPKPYSNIIYADLLHQYGVAIFHDNDQAVRQDNNDKNIWAGDNSK